MNLDRLFVDDGKPSLEMEMTRKTTTSIHTISFIIFSVLSLAISQDANGEDDVMFAGKYQWGYGKDISGPLSFQRSNSGSINPRNDFSFKGSVTYGTRGRWVGRAIPVFNQPKHQVVSTSMIVNGGNPTQDIYNPYGTRHFGSNFRPYSTPLSGSNYYPPSPPPPPPQGPNYYPQPPPPPPAYNNYPCSHCQGYYNSFGNPRVVYREVDPSYLVLGENVRLPRSFLLARDPVLINLASTGGTSKTLKKRPSKKNTHINKLSTNNLLFDESKVELIDLPSNRPKKTKSNLFTIFTRNVSHSVDSTVASAAAFKDKSNLNRVVSDIIRILPTRRKPNASIDTEKGPIYFSIKNHQNYPQDENESSDGGWTIIKPRFIGSIRRIFPSEDDTLTRSSEVEILSDISDRLTLFGAPVLPSVKKATFLSSSFGKPLKDRTLGMSVGKGRLEKEDRRKSLSLPAFPLQPIREIEKDSGMKLGVSLVTLTGTMIASVIMSHWLLQ